MEQAVSAPERPRRESVFHEVGLLDDKPPIPPPDYYNLTRANSAKINPLSSTPPIERIDEEDEAEGSEDMHFSWGRKTDEPARPQTRLRSRIYILRVALVALVILSLGHLGPVLQSAKPPIRGVTTSDCMGKSQLNPRGLEGRANSPTDVCKRWSHQSAIVNGTLYIYGGRATKSSNQITDTWSMYICFRNPTLC
jgi:hypothetical protein